MAKQTLSENLVSSIQQLIVLGKGDRGRLEYLLELISSGKPLPLSDQKYLESIIPLYLGSQDLNSVQRHAEEPINSLYAEVRAIGERVERMEGRGFERYVGKKAIFFFVTVFVGWHALQDPIVSGLGQYMSPAVKQYIFPLNTLADSFGIGQVVWMAFLLMSIAWPFIGAVHLARFISSRKIPKTV